MKALKDSELKKRSSQVKTHQYFSCGYKDLEEVLLRQLLRESSSCDYPPRWKSAVGKTAGFNTPSEAGFGEGSEELPRNGGGGLGVQRSVPRQGPVVA